MEYSTGMKLSSTAELQKTLIDAAEIIAVFISMVKSDEKPHESLHERELLEETALEIQAGKIFAESVYHYENGSIKLVALEARLIGGDITLSVHDAYEWVPLKDVCSYELAPADIPIAKSLIEKFDG
jgi:hypothetical protein